MTHWTTSCASETFETMSSGFRRTKFEFLSVWSRKSKKLSFDKKRVPFLKHYNYLVAQISCSIMTNALWPGSHLFFEQTIFCRTQRRDCNLILVDQKSTGYFLSLIVSNSPRQLLWRVAVSLGCRLLPLFVRSHFPVICRLFHDWSVGINVVIYCCSICHPHEL